MTHQHTAYSGGGISRQKAVVCQSNMTALLSKAALFISRYECNSPVAPSDLDRLISEYRLAQTALVGDPYCTSRGFLPPYIGIPPYSNGLVGGSLPYFDRPTSGYRLIGGGPSLTENVAELSSPCPTAAQQPSKTRPPRAVCCPDKKKKKKKNRKKHNEKQHKPKKRRRLF